MKLGIGLSLTRQRILGSGFSPSDISNLDIWYDFSTITADNDTAVSSFSNAGLGGSNYNLSQSSSGDQPTVDTSTMAKTSIEFTDAGTHSLDLANNYLTTGKTYTIFLVYKRDDLNDTDFLFVGDTAGHNKVELYGSGNLPVVLNANANTTGNAQTAITVNNTNNSTVDYDFTTNTEILVITVSTATAKIYNQDGDFIGQGTLATTQADTNFQLAIIGEKTTGGGAFGGNLGECGIYNKVLDATEISNLITHLKAKWSAE